MGLFPAFMNFAESPRHQRFEVNTRVGSAENVLILARSPEARW